MYFIVILAFALVLSDQLPPGRLNLINAGFADPETWLLTLLAGSAPLVVPMAVAYVARWRIRRAESSPGCSEDHIVAMLSDWNLVLIFALGGIYAALMLLTPWVPLVKSPQGMGLGKYPLLGDLIVLLPFVAGLFVIWIILYGVELRIKTHSLTSQADPHHQHVHTLQPVSLAAYLIDKCRHQFLLVAAPMLLIVFAKHFTDKITLPAEYQNLRLGFRVGDAVLGIISFFILLCSPVLLRYIWSTQPLPRGPLRDRFERICRRIGLRYREILLWKTHGMAVNAAVMGFIPPLRYILISDALLETMTDEEIEAVFGHEAGHVHHWHLPFFGIFAIVSMYIAGGVFLLLSPDYWNFLDDPSLLQLVSLGVLLAMWLFGFGWLSRRFERQADLFGVRCVTADVKSCEAGCPVHGAKPAGGLCISAANLFGRTLMKIAELNGIPREAPSWRHGSIESRCQLIEGYLLDAAAVRQFDRSVYRIKIGMLALAAIGTVIAVVIYLPGWRQILNMN